MSETVQPTQTANTPYASGGSGTAIGSLVGGLFNLVGAGINYGAQQQANMKNEELLRESWERDDSQMQRARRDAEAAGFSPLAALGNMPGNTNPTTMQAPQLDTSGVSNSVEGALNRKQAYDAMKQQQKIINAQVEGAEADTEGKKLDNIIRLAKAYDEIWGSKLEIGDKISAMLEAEVITEDDIPEAYKIFKATKTPGKERNLTERGIKAQETSNANTAWSIANQAEQFRETMNSTKEHNEQTEEYTMNFGVGSVKLGFKKTSDGMYLPITAGISPTAKPDATVNWQIPTPQTGMSKDYKFEGYTASGLPVVTNSTLFYPMVVIPTGRGNAKLYQIDKGSYIKSNAATWATKYAIDYKEMCNKLAKEKAF